jgi:transcriptional regulator with XRE-family HTH domain
VEKKAGRAAMIEETRKQVGERIRLAREQQGYSQAELGHDLGLSEAEVQHLEQGETPLILATLGNLCRALDCSLLYLLGIKGEELTPDEAELLEIYRTLPPGLPRDYVLTYLKSWGGLTLGSWGQGKTGGEQSGKSSNQIHWEV